MRSVSPFYFAERSQELPYVVFVIGNPLPYGFSYIGTSQPFVTTQLSGANMSVLQRLFLVYLGIVLGALSVLCAVLGYDYHFGTGYGLIGWFSFPMAVLGAWLSATAIQAGYYGEFA